MRMMVRWSVPVERGNEAIEDGTFERTVDSLIAALAPEAVYFFAENGERAGMMVFDITDSARIPEIAEPLFRTLDADVELVPVMNLDELKTALASVAAAQ